MLSKTITEHIEFIKLNKFIKPRWINLHSRVYVQMNIFDEILRKGKAIGLGKVFIDFWLWLPHKYSLTWVVNQQIM